MFSYYDHLGFMTPYYSRSKEGRLLINKNFSGSVSRLGALNIDVSGVIQVISHYHCFGDRTLIKGLKRTPWLAKPSHDMRSWEYADIPPHKNLKKPVEKVAQILKAHLEKELLVYLNGKKNVGVLLSGGMDSRILSAMLHKVKADHNLPISIIGLTWGIKESRDVKYAQFIASKLNWEWKHFNLSSENLIENINETAIHGCEFSPLHLHAMPKVRDFAKDAGLDCILAASFGDSIGRGEYAGRHVTKLIPIEKYVRNWFKLLKSDVYNDYKNSSIKDAVSYKNKYPHNIKLEELELEKQSQYLRRQLNPCMSVINEVVPLYQLFTAPSTYEFIWSLDPSIRNDQIYEELLKDLSVDLLNIPWARTGKQYRSNKGNADFFTKEHSFYGEWVRNDLKQITYENIFLSGLQSLNIFDMEILEQLWKTNQKYFNNRRHSKVEEIILWLSSLGMMIDRFNIKSEFKDSTRNDILKMSKLNSKAELLFYYLILKYKKVK